jgi:mannitol/fructose-specific phosphotransferase system IIA component
LFLLFQVSKGFFMSKPNMKTKASVFSMGQRSEVLSTDLEAPILVPHALEKTSTRVCITTY